MKKENKEKEIAVTGKVEQREITQELRESYLEYAMSVIVSRALPDVRDGLKPVQRRILWAMWDANITSGVKPRKSAYITGETMAKFHPHGDMAIYDALARMAQDFSLRYPLINGQGNWGCFTKDTQVKLADGRNMSFGELVREYKEGKKNFTYTTRADGTVALAEIKYPRRTKKNAPLVKITLDNGTEIKCTPDHRFMLKNGNYREARLLTPRTSLMPCYSKYSEKEDSFRREGYLLIYDNALAKWIPAHHLADEYNINNGIYAVSAGRVRHHVDFNKRNNNPENIRRVQWKDHWHIHAAHAALQHADPVYRKKIAAGRAAYWADPKNRAKNGMLLSERNFANWRNPAYRKRKTAFLRAMNIAYIAAHPEKRAELSARLTATLKRLWQNPEYQATMHTRIIKGNKNHTTNATGKNKFLAICRAVLKKGLSLSEHAYEKERSIVYPYGRAPLWHTAVTKYFKNNPELTLHELNGNHRVVRVEHLKTREDVYDLTIDDTHNFCLAAGVFVHNSIDGDSPAAQRYTECKLAAITEELLVDIDKETVDWQPNYDATREEPKYLPGKLPNLLLNGAQGIAVGMATSIPPHNLTEVVDAMLHVIENPDATSEDLMQFIQGPDFPGGGIIYDKKAIATAYSTGHGPITCRGVAEVEEDERIVISSIPYQVNKAEMIVKFAELVTEKKVEGIRDIRDESDKDIRIVIELKKDASGQKILNQLYQYTDLQKNFNVNLLALRDGVQPEVMSVKDIASAYIAHRNTIVRRRATFELKKARERAHILEGLKKALEEIDAVIATIKKSKDRADAFVNLMKKFAFTDLQTNAILDMRLQTLAALETKKIEDELTEKRAIIADLEALLKNAGRILTVIKKELADVKTRFGDARRTKVMAYGLKDFSEADLIPAEDALITFSASGYIKRAQPSVIKSQHRGGKGLIGADVGDEDFLQQIMTANTHDHVLFFTTRGRAFQTKAWEIPVGSRTSKGKLVQNFLDISPEEKISAIVSYPAQQVGYLVMVTKQGIIKKTPLKDFENVRKNGIIAIGLKKEDGLIAAALSSGKDDILVTTMHGQAIRFKETQIRGMSRTASGVIAIRHKPADTINSLNIISPEHAKTARLLVVMERGYGKQTKISEYKTQARGGSGIKTAKITTKTGVVVSAHAVSEEEELFVLSAKGQIIRTTIASVRTASRATQGVKIMNLNASDKIIGTICL